MRVRTAAVAWHVRKNRGDSGYFGHFHDLVSEAYDEGAELVVFPELHVLELLSLEPRLNPKNAAKYLAQYATAIEEWLERISKSSGMTIVGGSHFKATDDKIKNVCAIAQPEKPILIAEKNNLTAYERDVWQMEEGKGLVQFEPHCGVTICYDSEFPASGRALAEAGCLIQCVPAWTETARGFQRVRWSCLARAIEHQNFVVHASLVGGYDREPIPFSYGSSALIAPSIEPFPVEAILRETPINEEGVVIADLDFEHLEVARNHGEVRNWRDRNSGKFEVETDSTPSFPDLT